ncbi:tripartite motif-containing protein 16 isoform X2 [Oncorhynchus tshawytscha]|uniref:tripartite motif-containing protein 16 isoform X2 n=1 Tax=Oncorhynchus tshawytscha TaxID=74940 RepID=UPI001C3D3BCB|nr:tripartite motif-containing protein 16 isoform X2 [Oncorhynchus tshawytscha]
MAQQAVLLDQDQFCCSVCLDLLKEPITIPCGHSYCRSCIEGCWDQDVLKGYSCPQCRQTFTPRPTLRKNNMLAEVVEKLKKTGLQAAPPPALCYAEPVDVACDFCTGTRKQKALMSCLACLASYCETHLQSHYESPAFKKHKLVKATAQLQEKICSHHDKLLEVYCRTDQRCICYLCTMDEHKGHDTVSASAERTEKQRQLGMSQQKVQQRFQEREKELKELQQAVESFKHSAQAAVEDSEKIFTELIRSIERRRSEVKELIRAQEKAQVNQAEGLLEQVEQEIAELRKRSTELEQLSHTEDHIHFLQSYQSLSSISVSSDLPSIVVRPLQYFRDVSKTVSELREKLEDFLKGEWTKISTTVDVVLPPEPKTREQLLQYSCQLTLDPDTAHTHLSLSEGNRKVTYTGQVQPYPDHPDRFTNDLMVLCREGLSGRCYWEVEWSGRWVIIAVSYKDISRTGRGNAFGLNDKSWSLQCSSNGYCLRHNHVVTKVSGPQSSRVGVYLDHKAGTLSFYSVSDTMTLLHRVQTTFTQPLYPGVWLNSNNGTAELVKL